MIGICLDGKIYTRAAITDAKQLAALVAKNAPYYIH